MGNLTWKTFKHHWTTVASSTEVHSTLPLSEKSMIETAHLKIVAESDKYMENETLVGEFLFKLMMQNAVIYTRATYNYLK